MFAAIHVQGLSVEQHGVLMECAGEFSPLLEDTAPDTVVLDLRGTARLWNSPEAVAAAMARRTAAAGLAAAVAIASSPDAALLAARGFRGTTVIPPREEPARLGGLPVELLEPSEETRQTLARWGIRTLGDLAALPESGVAERLGAEGVRLWKRARGRWKRPFAAHCVPVVYEESEELDHPLELLEPLSFLLARMLNDMCARMSRQSLATTEATLRLKLADGGEHTRTLRLPFPTANPKALLKLQQLDLDAHPPGAPITAVTLRLEVVRPRALQHGLFRPAGPEPEKLEITLSRIASLVGEGNAGSPQVLDTHRPDAFEIVRFTGHAEVGNGRASPAVGEHAAVGHRNQFETGSLKETRTASCLAFRVFRPPLSVDVELSAGIPHRVRAQGLRGEVVAAAGQWRTSGDWWKSDPWSRDEWDIALKNGPLCRIYYDHLRRQWFVEGCYD